MTARAASATCACPECGRVVPFGLCKSGICETGIGLRSHRSLVIRTRQSSRGNAGHVRRPLVNAETTRLEEARQSSTPWRKWGPYLSERQWGTVREDYSDNGDAWNYFTHDQARSR